MAEGVGFPFPSLPLNEGRTYGQPEVVLISLPQVATGLRLRLPGSFRRRGFQPDLLMPQEALFAREAHSMQAAMRRALLRRGRSGNAAFSKTESNVAGNLCRIRQKGGIQTWRFFITALPCCDRLVEMAVKKNLLLEYNANGYRRGICHFPDGDRYQYPHEKLWKRVAEAGVRVVIGSDCHQPELMYDEAVVKAYQDAKERGLNVVTDIWEE